MIGISQRKSVLVLVFLVLYMIWIVIVIIFTLLFLLGVVGITVGSGMIAQEQSVRNWTLYSRMLASLCFSS